MTTKLFCAIMSLKLETTKQIYWIMFRIYYLTGKTCTEGFVMKLNKKRFLKFLFITLILFAGAFMENGNITGALVLAMLI